ncbi:MAG: glycosyltransferase family 4 protein [Armatimonadetes bacterium]|nr:glycosyltransferase family 4 protein [Armatimonadota bacterium]
MSLHSDLRRIIRFLKKVVSRNGMSQGLAGDLDPRTFELLRQVILRNEASSKPERLHSPLPVDVSSIVGNYSIGYSGNLLNNSYSFCKIARNRGVSAFLFLDPAFADILVTSQPRWEEVSFHGDEIPQSPDGLPPWDPPGFVKSATWNQDYFRQITQAFEHEKMRDLFRDTALEMEHGNDYSYLLNFSVAAHRDLLALYNTVDILQVSGSHVGLASFTRKPYVTFPYGADLFSFPFDDTEIGWIQARGFRKASRHIVSGKIMMEYMEILGTPRQKIDLLPMMIDTNLYAPIQGNPLKERLRSQYQDKTLFFVGSRQNWGWKGSDKLWRAVAEVAKKTDDAVFLTVWYGQDTAKSQELLNSLGLEGRVVKLGILSKGLLKQYIDAVDVCVDQFTHGGLGAFSLESMSCGKPLITYYTSAKHFDFQEDPPLLNAFESGEITDHILNCAQSRDALSQLGQRCRNWMKRFHGHEALWPAYEEVYRKALLAHRYKQ